MTEHYKLCIEDNGEEVEVESFQNVREARRALRRSSDQAYLVRVKEYQAKDFERG
jgi:hypothetical protein